MAETGGFLECIRANCRRGHLAADNDQRDGIGHAVAYRCDCIRGAGSGCHHDNPDLAAGPRITGCHEARALLVGGHDKLYFSFTIRYGVRIVITEHGVEDREDRSAAVAKDRVDPLISQDLHHRIRSRERLSGKGVAGYRRGIGLDIHKSAGSR